ncbi:MAG: bifunctional tetrahydrofolate synthase/dihydrofolate synthase [Gammaproteobacteria bacterium]|nr:bifunctional tetrahydrofolate synthase/dihydrofolate synthase [Gammaproteobacteria bacterium]
MNKPRFETLEGWLSWQETLHPNEIELGLVRVAEVFERLHSQRFTCPVITVAGTNGKGSSIRLLESIYLACGYTTASYTSPHLLHYNERIRLNGVSVSDDEIVTAFQRVDTARAEISLTYFEFGTLAALDIFMQQQPDVVLLEVGLGGRLDAVNIIDADIALITSISLDHTSWLGHDRESIGYEKAGILRAGKSAVCSEPDIPESILQHAQQLGASLHQIEKEYHYQLDENQWYWQTNSTNRILPLLTLSGQHQYQNAAGVIMVVQLLQSELPVTERGLETGLKNAQLAGRYQKLSHNPDWIVDVAHNPDGLQKLAQNLTRETHNGRTLGLVGMLADKDIATALAEICKYIDEWHIVPLPTSRSASVVDLELLVENLGIKPSYIHVYETISEAKKAIEKLALETDRIVVFGSFYTVSEVMKLAQQADQII